MILHLDPRSKLYLLILSNLLLFFHVSIKYECMIMVLFLALFFLSGKIKIGIKFSVIYFIFLFMDLYGVECMQKNIFLSFIAMIAVGFRMMVPCITIGTYTFITTSTSEMVCALRKLHVSEKIIIPFVVMIRYFPTVKEDFEYIKSSLSLRGIGESKKELLLHPFETLEYILVPVLMNSSFVASDLTIAALTKGLSIEGKHTCLLELKVTIMDYIYPILCTILVFLFLKGGM